MELITLLHSEKNGRRPCKRGKEGAGRAERGQVMLIQSGKIEGEHEKDNIKERRDSCHVSFGIESLE